jgi:hypothetical protein
MRISSCSFAWICGHGLHRGGCGAVRRPRQSESARQARYLRHSTTMLSLRNSRVISVADVVQEFRDRQAALEFLPAETQRAAFPCDLRQFLLRELPPGAQSDSAHADAEMVGPVRADSRRCARFRDTERNSHARSLGLPRPSGSRQHYRRQPRKFQEAMRPQKVLRQKFWSCERRRPFPTDYIEHQVSELPE